MADEYEAKPIAAIIDCESVAWCETCREAYRIDETWISKVDGKPRYSRLGARFDSPEEAQIYIDKIVLAEPISAGRTYTVHPEREF